MNIACLDRYPALVDHGTAYSLGGLLEQPSCLSGEAERMLALIRDWGRISAAIDAAIEDLPPVDIETAAWSAPVPRPGKIVAAPVNYRDHGAEMQMEATVEQLSVFLKAGTAVIGPGDEIVVPVDGRRIDHEAELAVVIGRRARHVAPAQALDHVFAYTCLIDVTMRGNEERSARKSYDTFAPMGPWAVTPDSVGDPGNLRIRCWVNGDLRQDASTSDLIMGVPELIAHASDIMTLEPGDVVSTGTPAGVGPIRPGDNVAVEIENIGSLQVGVRGPDSSRATARPGGAVGTGVRST